MENQNNLLKLVYEYFETSDINYIVSGVEELIGNPFYVFDSAYSLLFSSIFDYKKAKNVKKIKENISLDFKNIDIEILNSLYEDKSEYITKKFDNIDSPLTIRRIENKGNIVGFICIYEKNREFKESDKETIELLVNIVKHDLLLNGYSKDGKENLIIKLIENNDLEKEDINAIAKLLDLNIKEERRLMVIRGKENLGPYRNLVSNEIVLVYKNDIVTFIDSNRSVNEKRIKEIIEILKDKIDTIGISEVINDYSSLKKVYKQTIDSIDINKKYEKSNIVNYFEDYRLISLVSNMDKEEVYKLIDQRIIKVIEYDKKHKINYLNDIVAYFEADRNINKAAVALFVHKNSMYYRISKIKELFNIDLENNEDCFNAEVSLKLIKYADISI